MPHSARLHRSVGLLVGHADCGRTCPREGIGAAQCAGKLIPRTEPAARCCPRDDRRRVHRGNLDRAGDSTARIVAAGYSPGDRVQYGRLGRADRGRARSTLPPPGPGRRQFCRDGRVAALWPARRIGPLVAAPYP
jgi:hypothetical protein